MAEKEGIKSEGKLGKFVASIVELFSREIEVSNYNDVYSNDIDNLYPDRVELVERNSVTAHSSSAKLKAFIVGQGFEDNRFNDMIVNPNKNQTGYTFLNNLANSLKTHAGAFVHVNYDVEGNVNYLDVLDYKKCRVAKGDAFGFSGKIYYKDWSKGGKFSFGRKDSGRWFYPFNRSIEVITKQRVKDTKYKKGDTDDIESLIENYRGQVFFLSLDESEIYPHAWLHSVYNDADTEYRISLYRNSNFRNGFIEKTMLIPNGLDKESSDEFDKAVRGWLGAENSSSVFVFKPQEQIEDLDNVIKAVSLKSSYDSKRFELDEASIANNIRKAYLTIPKILIDPEDSFFGSSGEAFKAAIEYYNKETLFIRERITHMMDLFFEGEFGIKELGEESFTEDNNPEDEVADQ